MLGVLSKRFRPTHEFPKLVIAADFVVCTLLIALFFLVPHRIWESARLDSVLDGVVATVGFGVCLFLLLAESWQSSKLEFLVYGFLTASIVRFFGSLAEDMDDVIWLHRICGFSLGLAFLMASFPLKLTYRQRRFILAVAHVSAVSVGIALLLFPPFFELAYSKTLEFSFSIKALSFVAAAFFFLSAFFELGGFTSTHDDNLSLSIGISAVLFGLTVLLYPFALLWNPSWWLIQFVELSTTLFLLAFVFFGETRARMILVTSNEDLDRFAATASHDLKEPLRMISMYLGLLGRENKGKFSQSSEEYLAFARDGAKRLDGLLDALLSFARIDKGRTKFCDVDLNVTLQTALRNLEPFIVETGALVTYERLPCVRGETAFLTQLFQNLVANAIKYRKQSVPPEVHVFVKNHRSRWCIGIRDNGIGFSPE